jgi:hypothetical protein
VPTSTGNDSTRVRGTCRTTEAGLRGASDPLLCREGRRVVIGKAFVSFRVGDAEAVAELIDQGLCRAFGTDKVFRSSRAMHGGALFPPTLGAEAADCAVMIAVIGRRWLADADGVRRIDNPHDWVRQELELALASGRPVIPVLTDDRPPLGDADRLPPSIAGLADRTYLRFSGERDLPQIIAEVRPHMNGKLDPVRLVSLRPAQRSPDVRFGSAELGGVFHADSIVFRPTGFAAHVRGTITFVLGMRYRTLTVTAGVLDDAREPEQVGVFTIIGDGRRLKQLTVTRGQPRSLTVDVTDVLNLRLEAYRPGTTTDAGGRRSSKLPELAWGDPVVRP